MSSKQNVNPLAGILSGALVWGLIWYPYRVLYEAGVSGPLAILLSNLLAIMCGVFVLPRVWREFHPQGEQAASVKKMQKGLVGWAIVLLLSVGWTNLSFVLAMLQGEVMRVMLLFYLSPLWTILFSYWLLGERLNVYGYLIMALALCGAFVMLWEPRLGMPLPQNVSEWLGLSAGMGFALSNVVSRRAESLSVEAKSFSVWVGTVLMTLPLLLWQGGLSLQGIDTYAWLILGLLGIVLCAISFAVQYGVTHLPANRATLVFLFELVVAAIASYFLTNEAMEFRDWIGATLIICATLLSGKLFEEGK